MLVSCIVVFDSDTGPRYEHVFPEHSQVPISLPVYALCDGVHEYEQVTSFLSLGGYRGVSFYKSRADDSMKRKRDQTALVLLCSESVSFFHIKRSLEAYAPVFFDSSHTRLKALKDFHQIVENAILSKPDDIYESRIREEVLRRLVQDSGNEFVLMAKALSLGASVLVYCESARVLSEIVVCIGEVCLVDPGHALPYVPLNDIPEVFSSNPPQVPLIVGTSNLLYATRPCFRIDVVVNFDSNEVLFASRDLCDEDIVLTGYDRQLIHSWKTSKVSVNLYKAMREYLESAAKCAQLNNSSTAFFGHSWIRLLSTRSRLPCLIEAAGGQAEECHPYESVDQKRPSLFIAFVHISSRFVSVLAEWISNLPEDEEDEYHLDLTWSNQYGIDM
jgi:hypothetical protein